MQKRRFGMAAAVGLGITALLGAPQVTAQEDPPPEGATAAQLAGAEGTGAVTYSADGADTNGPRTANADSDIEFVALGSGCRVFDTRSAVGPLTSGVQRTYSLKSGLIPGQGGKAGGCGIPSSAVAVDMSLSTLANSPSGTGFVRAGQGSAAPTATVLQFLRNQGTSVTTTVPMDSSLRIRLLASGGSTGMTGDVLGYWEETLHATVRANGTLERSSGVVGINKFSSPAGFYVITFDRDVSKCTPVASPDTSATAIVGATLNGPVGEVFVRTRDGGSANSDEPLRVTVNC